MIILMLFNSKLTDYHILLELLNKILYTFIIDSTINLTKKSNQLNDNKLLAREQLKRASVVQFIMFLLSQNLKCCSITTKTYTLYKLLIYRIIIDKLFPSLIVLSYFLMPLKNKKFYVLYDLGRGMQSYIY